MAATIGIGTLPGLEFRSLAKTSFACNHRYRNLGTRKGGIFLVKKCEKYYRAKYLN